MIINITANSPSTTNPGAFFIQFYKVAGLIPKGSTFYYGQGWGPVRKKIRGEKVKTKEEKLTRQQSDFITNLVQGDSQRQAYQKAYPKNKGSDKTIDQKARELFNMGKVRARYEEGMAEVAQRWEEKAIVTREEIIEGFAMMAFPDRYGSEEVANQVRIKALELLGKHLGIFTEKISMTVDKPIIIDDIGDADE